MNHKMVQQSIRIDQRPHQPKSFFFEKQKRTKTIKLLNKEGKNKMTVTFKNVKSQNIEIKHLKSSSNIKMFIILNCSKNKILFENLKISAGPAFPIW